MTLLDRARSGDGGVGDGVATDEIRRAATEEGIDADKLRRLVASGCVVLPRNVASEALLTPIGECIRTRVNANIGTSADYADINEEIEKARVAVRHGADTVMDLSTGGDLDAMLKKVRAAIDVPVGTVPIYRAVCGGGGRALPDITPDDLFNAVRNHAQRGVDFMTIHAGVNRESFDCLRSGDRILSVVSRGGALTIAWMLHHEAENPFYAEFDYLLEIAREYDVTISLGDGMRPGCIADANDHAMFAEIIALGRLVKRSRAAGVQCMVEGPGHIPMDGIEYGVRTAKSLCDSAPLYLLGPLVTDLAPGYDHIAGAIGGAIAGMHGADFLCMMTPAEHLALPTIDDIREGTIITRIAAHAIDLVKPGVRDRAHLMDRRMAIARKNLDWAAQFECAIDGTRARSIHDARGSGGDACSMCGELCAIKVTRDALDEKG
ncbi:MAG: phosphomethylpyrimidine synthase ThiC [Euryarchaeota archaeon]|nr:MAG: Phosphomethylpyrimidine synthase [ANME-2 cluster archaeon]MEA1865684.1 phosphomethylpyrimidine synthase ThiC [Euryarchaeota archaeon]